MMQNNTNYYHVFIIIDRYDHKHINGLAQHLISQQQQQKLQAISFYTEHILSLN